MRVLPPCERGWIVEWRDYIVSMDPSDEQTNDPEMILVLHRPSLTILSPRCPFTRRLVDEARRYANGRGWS